MSRRVGMGGWQWMGLDDVLFIEYIIMAFGVRTGYWVQFFVLEHLYIVSLNQFYLFPHVGAGGNKYMTSYLFLLL